MCRRQLSVSLLGAPASAWRLRCAGAANAQQAPSQRSAPTPQSSTSRDATTGRITISEPVPIQRQHATFHFHPRRSRRSLPLPRSPHHPRRRRLRRSPRQAQPQRQPQALGSTARIGAGRHRLHERAKICVGGHRNQGLRRRDRRDAEKSRQCLLLPRQREIRQERFRRGDRRLRPGASLRPVGPRLSQQPRLGLRSQEGHRPRDRRLQRGHQDQPQFDLRLQQPRRGLSKEGRLRPRRRRLRRGNETAAEQHRRLECALLGARDQSRPDAAGAVGLQRGAQDQA